MSCDSTNVIRFLMANLSLIDAASSSERYYAISLQHEKSNDVFTIKLTKYTSK